MKNSQKIPKKYNSTGNVEFNSKFLESQGIAFTLNLIQFIFIFVFVGIYILTNDNHSQWQIWFFGLVVVLIFTWQLIKPSLYNQNQLNIKTLLLYFLKDTKKYDFNIKQEQNDFLLETENNEKK